MTKQNKPQLTIHDNLGLFLFGVLIGVLIGYVIVFSATIIGANGWCPK